MIKIGIITASDQGSKGLRKDLSSEVIRKKTATIGEVVQYSLVADEKDALVEAMKECIRAGAELVLTTGGTGFSKRDVTPEATLAVVERLTPGIPEAMRSASMKITDRAMLSRAVAGIVGETLIVNLPGSPKACEECLDVILPALPHGLEILRGEASECAR
ncbi:MogA/MoaB family molybdenum cofactor biosynthesis protein [Clostridia bacterium]|nr:MogA/MoaB family molybdenum cofactor biosynthesis protein [Clostridia bacterium]